ncbi:hypothetical protein [Streptomyces liangshanensis]|uniref:hypothetical protein n=1 Tax=Streptomyces liangshanensis TaxID=2717324 RepID=UPI0036DD99E8
MSGESRGHDTARTEELRGREGIRKRPGMWIGSTGVRGLHGLVFEVVGRAVNQVLSGAEAASTSRSRPTAACGSPTASLVPPSRPPGTPTARISTRY